VDMLEEEVPRNKGNPDKTGRNFASGLVDHPNWPNGLWLHAWNGRLGISSVNQGFRCPPPSGLLSLINVPARVPKASPMPLRCYRSRVKEQ